MVALINHLLTYLLTYLLITTTTVISQEPLREFSSSHDEYRTETIITRYARRFRTVPSKHYDTTTNNTHFMTTKSNTILDLPPFSQSLTNLEYVFGGRAVLFLHVLRWASTGYSPQNEHLIGSVVMIWSHDRRLRPLSVCPSVCDDQVSRSHRLEFFENNFTAK